MTIAKGRLKSLSFFVADRPMPYAEGNYEHLRRRHLADAMALEPDVTDRIDWPLHRLADYRIARLRELVRIAIERSSWHRARLADVEWQTLDEESLRSLPVMTKSDLMDNFDNIVTDPRLRLGTVNEYLDQLTPKTYSYLFDRYTAIASSGSSGRRGVFVYDWEAWATYYLSLHRYLLRMIRRDPTPREMPVVMARVGASHPTHATAAFSQTFSGPHLLILKFPVTMAIEQIVAGLNDSQPTVLGGYPSALHLLTHEAKAGRLRIAPKVVLAGAEPLLPEVRLALEETWSARVGSQWGTSEGGGTGVACAESGMHLSDDLLVVEPIDEHGYPVAPGERSAKIYLTNLYNHTLPLIRYEITDEVTVMKAPCPCGSEHRRIADIQGRLDDVFKYGEIVVHPHVFRSHLGRERNIVEYQVLQTVGGAAIAIRCTGFVDVESLQQSICEDLARLGMSEPVVSTMVVDSIARQAAGKLKRFVPLT